MSTGGERELVTGRLSMRPLGRAHLEDMVALYHDPLVARFLAPLDRAGHLLRLEDAEQAWAALGYGRAAIFERATGDFVGRGGLHYWPQFDEVEVGWVLRREAWGCGYATEAGRAWVEWGLEHLEVDYITANIDPDNTASGAVAGRLGMTPLRMDVFHGRPVVVYAARRTG